MFEFKKDNVASQSRVQEQSNQNTQETSKTGSAKTSFSFDIEKADKVEAVLRKPRSQAFLDAVASIDMLSSTDEEIIAKLKERVDEETLEEFKEMTTQELLEEIMLSFKEEMQARAAKLEDVPEPPFPEAIVSKCYISGCDIHAIDKSGCILEHYNTLSRLSGGLANARILYHKNKDCNCIEVYSDKCIVVNSDGTTKIYKNEDI